MQAVQKLQDDDKYYETSIFQASTCLQLEIWGTTASRIVIPPVAAAGHGMAAARPSRGTDNSGHVAGRSYTLQLITSVEAGVQWKDIVSSLGTVDTCSFRLHLSLDAFPRVLEGSTGGVSDLC